MVKLDVVRSCNAAVVKSQPLVVVVVGGTSGIGEYTIHALAAATAANKGKGFRVYVVGRKEASGKRVIDQVLKVCPSADVRFVRAEDVALLKDVDRVSAEIISLEEAEVKKSGGKARIDFLVMTQGTLYFSGRRETPEGLDILMSLLYYSRIRFIMNFLPLLLASSFPAHIVSVFGPGRDEKFIPDDISLRSPKNYGFMSMGSHAAYMKTFVFERLASQYPGKLSLTHYFPGLVLTEGFNDPTQPAWFRWSQKVLKPLIRWSTVPQMESGERVLFHTSPRFPARETPGAEDKAKSAGVEVAVSSDEVVGGGAYRVLMDGKTLPVKEIYTGLRKDGWSQKFWDHTMKAFEEIEAGRKFTE